MMRTGRILLVEPEDDFRRDLDHQLDLAGHDVAAVPDEGEAARLLEEGLDPDVVVVDGENGEGGDLRRLAPRAVVLRIDRALDRTKEFDSQIGEFARCAPDAGDVLRRVEELLLRHHPMSGTDPGSRCLDLARRLANALPRTRSVDERIDLVTEAFDTFFGVRGTLVVRRGLGSGGWIEATQAMSGDVAERIGEEIRRRSRTRDIRPFLTRLPVGSEIHEIACLAITIARDEEIDLALELERAPSQPGQRESLMNLVGSAVRASAATDELEDARSLAQIHRSILDSVIEATRALGTVGERSELVAQLLSILRRELSLTHAVLFEPGDDDRFEPSAASGFRLEEAGLRGFLGSPHGSGVHSLAGLDPRVVPGRAREALEQLGLGWVAGLDLGDDRTGLVFGGRRDEGGALVDWERRLLQALLDSATVALRNLLRLDELAELSAGSLRGLVAAAELGNPWDRGHSERVARTAVRLGRALGMSERSLRDLSLAAILHDVGKVGAESDPERAGKMHPVVGSTIVSRGRHSADVIQGVEQHHERFDGEGFPFGLAGEAIHPFGRILAVADAYDRMTRAAESPLSADEALARLERGAGLRWDPGLVTLFIEEIGRGPALDSGPPSAVWLRQIVARDPAA